VLILFIYWNLQILQSMLDELNISNAVWKRNKTKDFYQVTFPADGTQCETVLQQLHTAGFGSKFNSTLRFITFTDAYINPVIDSLGFFDIWFLFVYHALTVLKFQVSSYFSKT